MSKLIRGYPAEWISAAEASGGMLGWEGIGQKGQLTVYEFEDDRPGKNSVRFVTDDMNYIRTSRGEIKVSDDRLRGAHLYLPADRRGNADAGTLLAYLRHLWEKGASFEQGSVRAGLEISGGGRGLQRQDTVRLCQECSTYVQKLFRFRRTDGWLAAVLQQN